MATNGKKTSAGVSRNRLSNKELVKLVAWVEKNKEAIRERGLSVDDVADEAANSLGFPVVSNNLKNLASGEDAIIDRVWGSGDEPDRDGTLETLEALVVYIIGRMKSDHPPHVVRALQTLTSSRSA